MIDLLTVLNRFDDALSVLMLAIICENEIEVITSKVHQEPLKMQEIPRSPRIKIFEHLCV